MADRLRGNHDPYISSQQTVRLKRRARPSQASGQALPLPAEVEEELRFARGVYATTALLTRVLDPELTLKSLLEKALAAIDHDRGTISVFFGHEARIVTVCGYTPEQTAALQGFRLSTSGRSIQESMTNRMPIIVPDTRTQPDWVFAPGLEWLRSHLSVPIVAHDLVIGHLGIDSDQPKAFSAKYVERLRVFADFAAVTLENSQLYDELMRDAVENQSLHRATAFLFKVNLFTADNLLEVGEEIVRAVVVEFGAVDCGLMLLDAETGHLTRLARAGEFQVQANQSLHINGHGLVPRALRTGDMVYAPDVTSDTHYAPNNPLTRCELVVPLRTAKGVIGVLDLQSAEVDAFNDSDRRLLTAFAERVAVVIENIILYNQVREHADNLERRVAQRTRELNRALERERELSDLKSRFIARVSHEFRTPLAVMNTASDLLMNYGDRMNDDQRTEKLTRIRNEVNSLTLMLDDILTISVNGDDGKATFRPDMFDLKHLAGEAVRSLRGGAGADHDLHYEYSGQAYLYADPIWIRRIIQNLLSNAVKYSEPGSPIFLVINCTEHETVIRVQDQGIGIPEMDQPHLFDVFHRAVNVDNVSGTGLGLAIVRQGVELHGGEITYSTKLGTGTTFVITLPHKSTR